MNFELMYVVNSKEQKSICPKCKYSNFSAFFLSVRKRVFKIGKELMLECTNFAKYSPAKIENEISKGFLFLR